MYFDFFTAAALVDEFNTLLAGGRVQDVLQIDDLSLGFEIYNHQTRHYLYMSAEPEQPRAHLVSGKLRRGAPQPSPLVLLLKRYVDGGKIIAVRQPPWERIIIFDVLHADGEFSLIVEPIERRANIILVENDIIRECIRRVHEDENRVRQLLPGHPYQPPPPQDKLEPQMVMLEDVKRFLDSDIGAKVPQALTRGIHGISPLLGREVAFRATGKPNARAADVSPRDVFDALKAVITPLLAHDWQPGYSVEEDEDGDTEPTTYAMYPVTHRGEWRPVDSPSAALEAYYGDASGEHAYEAAKRPLRRQIKDARKKLSAKLYSLKNQQREESAIEKLRQSGELLLAYQHQIAKQQTEFSAQYDYDSEPITIKLDPLLTAVENAQRYFAKYEKAKRSREHLPKLIRETERELRYLSQLENDLNLAANWTEIGEVQQALQDTGYWRGAKRKAVASGKSSPLKITAEDGTVIWIGRNSRQNEEVTFNKGALDDLWLHVRGAAGSHVLVKNGGRAVDPSVLEYAASLAAYYSQLRHSQSAEVIVTERKHIRKIPGGKPGMVRIGQETRDSVNAVPRAPKQET